MEKLYKKKNKIGINDFIQIFFFLLVGLDFSFFTDELTRELFVSTLSCCLSVSCSNGNVNIRTGYKIQTTVEPGYNDIGLSDTSSITSDILWYQLIPHC